MFRYASFHQFVGDAAFGAVVLNPDFAVFDVEVQNAAVDSTLVGPTDVDNLVAVSLGIENRLFFEGTFDSVVKNTFGSHNLILR